MAARCSAWFLRWSVAALGLGIGLAGCTALLGDEFVVDPAVNAAAGTTASAGSAGSGAVGATGGAGAAGASGGDGASSVGGAGGSCNLDTHRCVPEPGSSWTGPFAVASQLDGCGGAFPTELGPLRDQVSVAASSCACGCGQPTVSCPSSMDIVGFAGAGCTNAQGQHDLSPNQCYDKLATSASHQLVVANPVASCGTGSVTPDFGAIGWQVDLLACAAPAGAPCVDTTQTCVPQPTLPFEAAICVWQAGNVPCPDEYPDRSLYYQQHDDERSCPASCACAAAGARCDVTASTYYNTGCANAAGTGTVTSDSPLCTLNGTVNSIRAGTPSVGVAGSCVGTDPSASGEVVPTDPVTVCCR